MLKAIDGFLGENGKKHVPSFLCLGILEKNKRPSRDPWGSVEARIFVPSFATVVDVVECVWASEMQLCKGPNDRFILAMLELKREV
jgi:hypothetical protein